MPRLLKLMFQVPMSSPQMTRMFGFFACASAAGAATAAKTRARTVQSEPRNRCKRGGVFMVILDSNAGQWPEGERAATARRQETLWRRDHTAACARVAKAVR